MTKLSLIVDLQFGSTGKGLIAGYLAERDEPDLVINANMPNAGHTYINDEGRTWIHKVLPNGIVSPKLKSVLIGPQSVFDLDRLIKEVEDSQDLLRGRRIWIHEDAVILHEAHRLMEKSTLSGISSTMQGSAVASISKMMRDPSNNHRAKDSEALRNWAIKMKGTKSITIKTCGSKKWLDLLHGARKILAEGAQGYSLGLNAGFWPYCTSRDCTPARFLADMGIPLNIPIEIIGTARVHPIRVGSTEDGYSGDVYPDQRELTWEDVGIAPELTTVTGRERRIFTWSEKQFHEAVQACSPSEIFLNFANYDHAKAEHLLNKYIGLIRYVGFGAKRSDIIDVSYKNDVQRMLQIMGKA